LFTSFAETYAWFVDPQPVIQFLTSSETKQKKNEHIKTRSKFNRPEERKLFRTLGLFQHARQQIAQDLSGQNSFRTQDDDFKETVKRKKN